MRSEICYRWSVRYTSEPFVIISWAARRPSLFISDSRGPPGNGTFTRRLVCCHDEIGMTVACAIRFPLWIYFTRSVSALFNDVDVDPNIESTPMRRIGSRSCCNFLYMKLRRCRVAFSGFGWRRRSSSRGLLYLFWLAVVMKVVLERDLFHQIITLLLSLPGIIIVVFFFLPGGDEEAGSF